MSRSLRIQYEGAVYHVMSRGNAREAIVRDDHDRRQFMHTLEWVVGRCGWLIYAYCLMDNHYHLVLETPRANLSYGMRLLNGVYTQRFNRRHGRVGHVLQGRFMAMLVEKERYLLEVCRYVALNPVRARLVWQPEQWAWSSYRATAGYERTERFLHTDAVLILFASHNGDGKWERDLAQEAYRMYIKDGIMDAYSENGERGLKKEVKGQIYLGSDDFVQKLLRDHRENESGWHGAEAERVSEYPMMQRRPVRMPLIALLKNGGAPEELENALKAGYKGVEVAEFLGLHYSAVSQRIRRAKRMKTKYLSNVKT